MYQLWPKIEQILFQKSYAETHFHVDDDDDDGASLIHACLNKII